MSDSTDFQSFQPELKYRESQLGEDLDSELEKALTKIYEDGRLINLREIKRLPITIEGRVLELGAGSCWFSSELSKFKEIETIYAVDFSKTLLARIAPRIMEKLGANEGKIKRIAADFNKLPFKNCSFDSVVVDAALHHAVDLKKLLVEIKRVLTDNGIFLAIREPVLPLWRKRIKKSFALEEKARGITENIYTLYEWKVSFQKSGWNVKAISTKPTHEPVSFKKVKKILRLFLRPFLNRFLFGYYLFLAKKRI